MPDEKQYKMQKKCGLSKTYFFMDECCRYRIENSKNIKCRSVKKTGKNINNGGNTVNMYPTRLNLAVMF